jgi:heat shock protein HtpX
MQAVGLQTYIWNNNIRSVLLLAGFPVLLLGMVFCLEMGMIWGGLLPASGSFAADVGYALRLMIGSAPVAIVVAAIWFVIAYVFNGAIIDMATGAKPVSREEEPELYNLLENLCISRGLKTPAIKVIETDGMNAFAAGLHEGHFSVTVTRGLLQSLDKDELECVLAHELTHIINRDVRTMVVAAIFQIIYRSIIWGGGRTRKGVGVFLVVAAVVGAVGYVLAIVIRMAISRSREFVADAGSVELTKNPDAMISALRKVSGHTHLHAPQSMRAMFLEDDDDGIMGLFATHPPVSKRIAALQQYGGGRLADEPPDAPAPSPVAQPPSPAGPWGAPANPPPGSPRGPWG